MLLAGADFDANTCAWSPWIPGEMLTSATIGAVKREQAMKELVYWDGTLFRWNGVYRRFGSPIAFNLGLRSSKEERVD